MNPFQTRFSCPCRQSCFHFPLVTRHTTWNMIGTCPKAHCTFCTYIHINPCSPNGGNHGIILGMATDNSTRSNVIMTIYCFIFRRKFGIRRHRHATLDWKPKPSWIPDMWVKCKTWILENHAVHYQWITSVMDTECSVYPRNNGSQIRRTWSLSNDQSPNS